MPELNSVSERIKQLSLSLASGKGDETSRRLMVDEITFRTFQAGAILAGGSGSVNIDPGHFISDPPPIFAQI